MTRWQWAMVGGGLLAVGGIVALLYGTGAEETAQTIRQRDWIEAADGTDAGYELRPDGAVGAGTESGERVEVAGGAGGGTDGVRDRPSGRGGERASGESRPAGDDSSGGDDGDPHVRTAAATEGGADAGRTTGDATSFRMPGRGQAMGPSHWMAEVPDAEQVVLQEELERDVGRVFAIDVADRRRAVDRIDTEARRCFADQYGGDPSVTGGQLIVSFDLVIENQTARTENPSLRDAVDAEAPAFLDCVRQAVEAVGFEASRDGTMHVEHPIFFGDRRLDR